MHRNESLPPATYYDPPDNSEWESAIDAAWSRKLLLVVSDLERWQALPKDVEQTLREAWASEILTREPDPDRFRD